VSNAAGMESRRGQRNVIGFGNVLIIEDLVKIFPDKEWEGYHD